MTDEILVAVVGDTRPRARAGAALARESMPPIVQAGSVEALLMLTVHRRPHIVVVAGNGDPIATIRQIARRLQRTRLVAVVPAPDRAVVREAVGAGADGVVVAADVPVTLPITVRAVWAGQTTVPIPARATLEAAALSHREGEVLELVSAGLTNAEIAERLCVTEHTVKSHVGALFTKLGVHSRGEAIEAHRARAQRRFEPSAERRSSAITGGKNL